MLAIMKNNVELVKILLQKYDIDLERPNNDGYCPLPFAMEEGHAEIVILLLQKGANADDLNFDKFDFSNTNLHYIKVRNSSFKDAIFVNTNLTNATLAECNFTQARMENTNLIKAKMHECYFTEARMENTKLTNADVIECVFNNATISNTDFSEADLIDCVFNDATISNTDFSEVYLVDCFFNDATISNTDFSEATLIRVNLEGATITESNFTHTDLTLDDFNGATLNNNDLSNMAIVEAVPDTDDETDDETALLREQLLTTNVVTLQKSDINPFIKSDLKGFDLIEGIDVDLCYYIESDPKNVLFIYEGQTALIDKEQLRNMVNDYDDQIVFQCENIDTAFTPRQENIIEGPHLNMRSIGIYGVMIPLDQLSEVIVRDKQIFVIQTDSKSKSQQIPIASLSTILGGNVVSADHCQAAVSIAIGNISYVDNETLQKQCVKQVQRTIPEITRTIRKQSGYNNVDPAISRNIGSFLGGRKTKKSKKSKKSRKSKKTKKTKKTKK